MKPILVSAMFIVVFSAHALVKDPSGKKPKVPEQSTSLLESQQALNGARKPVEERSRPPESGPRLPARNIKAESAVAAVARLASHSERGAHGESRPVSPTRMPLLAILLACGAFGVFWIAGKKNAATASNPK